jgi:hypothetical protein
MSERALAYGEEPLSHRILILYEAAGLTSDFASYLIRSLLSEGRLRYETVEKTSSGLRTRVIEREGPTGLIVTTTRTRLHFENETRFLSLPVTDTRKQTRAVMVALADEAEPDGESVGEEWLALQEWIAAGENRVTIPFARRLSHLVPPVAVRLRRDFKMLLNLIRVHAILHQASRDKDEAGRILATLDDYSVVRELVADLVAEGVEATVPAIVRETVEAVDSLLDADEEGGVTLVAIARVLKVDKSTCHYRVRKATDLDYLRNLEDRKGRPGRFVLGDKLPAEIVILPTPEDLIERKTTDGQPHRQQAERGEPTTARD